MAKSLLVIPDLDPPRCHITAVCNVIRFVIDSQPDSVLLVARFAVCTETHSTCTALASLIREMRKGFHGSIVFQHCPFRQEYAARHCPATCDRKFSEVEVRRVYGPFEILPGWVSDYASNLGDSAYKGSAAIRLARALDKSTILYGTGATAVIGETSGPQNARRTIWGVEIGGLHGRDALNRVVRESTAPMAFGVLTCTGGAVQPTSVAVRRDGSFTLNGVRYQGGLRSQPGSGRTQMKADSLSKMRFAS